MPRNEHEEIELTAEDDAILDKIWDRIGREENGVDIATDAQFDVSTDWLRHSDSLKWTFYPPDVLPLWVADMDFAVAPSILAALHARLESPIGYHLMGTDPQLTPLLRAKLERTGLTDLPETGWVHFLAGVVQGLYAGVLGLTSVGDEVLTMTPIYPPFLSAITDHGRVQRLAKLMETDAGWAIDFDALESAVTPATKLLMLCNPHNPTGRVWTIDELRMLATFAERHNLYVVTDELHGDLLLEGAFTPFASVASDALKQRTVTLTGPCKTYNTAGLGIGAMFSHSRALITQLKKPLAGIGGHCQLMSIVMWRAALRDDGAWLANVLKILRGNRDFLVQSVRDHLPGVKIHAPQATYLAWLDYRAHSRAGTDIQKYLLDTAKVGLNPGPHFGAGYEGFVRLNFATSRAILSEAMQRLAKAN